MKMPLSWGVWMIFNARVRVLALRFLYDYADWEGPCVVLCCVAYTARPDLYIACDGLVWIRICISAR